MTDRVKVKEKLYGQIVETKKFTFEVKFILGLKNTRTDGLVAKLGLKTTLNNISNV